MKLTNQESGLLKAMLGLSVADYECISKGRNKTCQRKECTKSVDILDNLALRGLVERCNTSDTIIEYCNS